jgi:DNA-binding transcriptional regulator GbsR (MarR family)
MTDGEPDGDQDLNSLAKEIKQGDRKEYFIAGKDMWETARKITYE